LIYFTYCQTLCYLFTVWSTNTSNKTLHRTNSIQVQCESEKNNARHFWSCL